MRRGVKAAVAAGLVAAAYPAALRPWFLRWGATTEEATQRLPGDEIVTTPRTRSTRAIAIDAGPDEVWPWLAQLGQGRGGIYSYDFLDNLFGYDIHSLDRVVPELQRIEPGDRIRLAPADAGADVSLEVAIAEPGRALVLHAPGTPVEAFAGGMGYPSWAFVIEPVRPGRVRLIVRWRCDFKPTVRGYLSWKYGIEPVHFLMERGMLRGIKRRAEALHAGPKATNAAGNTESRPRAESDVG